MSIRTLAARGLSFAHLAGLSARGARAEGDEPEEEDKKDARRAEDDEPKEKDDDKEGAKGSRADDADDEYADDESDKKDDKAKGKTAKAEDDEKEERAEDDDDDDEMRGKSAVANARRRERARCAAIFASPAAARNPVLAANLAFKSRMTRSEAIATLEGTPAPASASHAQRSARNPNLGVDGGAKPSPQQATAARWDANLKAANPSRR